jgi:Type III flagellar switch regulator (C-ring) FliN C-term
MSLNLEAGEADYFSAILAMQNDALPTAVMPDALSDEIKRFKEVVGKQDVNWPWPKPVLFDAYELVAFGASKNLVVLLKKDETQSCVIALTEEAMVSLASLLLGGKPPQTKRAPSRIEVLIAQGFSKEIHAGFHAVEAPQSAIIWQDFVGAKLAIDDRDDSPFFVVMINRRAEAAPVHEIRKTDVQSQNHIRQTIGNGVLNVDYVLNGGAVSLALLRNLEAGSVLPLAALDDHSLQARANGKAVFNGVLNLAGDQIGMNATQVLTGVGNE